MSDNVNVRTMVRWAGALGAAALLTICSLGTAQGQVTNPSLVRIPVKDRTTERLRELTPAQRYHSSLFGEYRDPAGNRMLDGLMSRWSGTHPNLDAPRRTLQQFARDLSCADADQSAFEGVLLSSPAFPIDDGSYLFSDHTLRVTKAFKSPFGRPLHAGSIVIVGRPSGELPIEGVVVRATSPKHPLLTLGATYVMFARHHRDFQVFHTSDPVFLVEGGRTTPVAPEYVATLDFPAAREGDVIVPRISVPQAQFEDIVIAAAACRVQQPALGALAR